MISGLLMFETTLYYFLAFEIKALNLASFLSFITTQDNAQQIIKQPDQKPSVPKLSPTDLNPPSPLIS